MALALSLDDPTTAVVVYALAGAAYALVGYLTKAASNDRPLRPRKAAKTVVIGVVAGAVVATQGDELTTETLAAAMGVAVPLADQLFNHLAPPSWGGSDTHGRGGGRSGNGGDAL